MESCEEAKDYLIQQLMDVTLTNPLDKNSFKVETDASDHSIGSALFCRRSSTEPWMLVEFVSKSLNEIQRRWPVHERECYAIVHALERYDPYLRGRKFQILTDNASLKWIQTTKTGHPFY